MFVVVAIIAIVIVHVCSHRASVFIVLTYSIQIFEKQISINFRFANHFSFIFFWFLARKHNMNATSERKRRCGKWKIILVSLCNPFFPIFKRNDWIFG